MHKSKRNATGNSEKVVHSWFKISPTSQPPKIVVLTCLIFYSYRKEKNGVRFTPPSPSSPGVYNAGVLGVLRTPCETEQWRDIFQTFAQTAFAVVSCAVPGLSEFYSPVASMLQIRVCDISGAHLQGSKTRNRQDIRAEPQLISAVASCAVPGLKVFYTLILLLRSSNPGCALFEAHTSGLDCSYSKRHSLKLFLQLQTALL